MRYLRFTNWLGELDRLSGPIAAIWFEEVRRHAGTDASHIYGGLMATLTAWAELRGVPYEGVPVGTIKRHATGKGNADKAAMVAAIEALGFHPADDKDRGMLLPEGWYAVVKRFSAKEERRRIVASVWSPLDNPGEVAFENHLNVFHIGGHGIDENLAKGISVWLNSSIIDKFFRTFSGHTQVNATDLRTLRFPNADALRDLGRNSVVSQLEVDSLVKELIAA